MDNRRQSGLWARNAQTGVYEPQQQPPQRSGAGPYQYYQPPLRRSTEEKGRSFSKRASEADGELPDEDILLGDTTRKRAEDAVQAAKDEIANGPLRDVLAHGETTSEHFANTQHVNSTALPGSSPQAPLQPEVEFLPDLQDDIPANLRAKPWSPAPPLPAPVVDDIDTDIREEGVPTNNTRQSSTSSGVARRGSVPHRSPLQKLEGQLGSISKEEKRARMREAETRTRQRSLGGSGKEALPGEGELIRTSTLRSERGRVISDGSKRSKESASDKYYQDRQGQVSPASHALGSARDELSTDTENMPHLIQYSGSGRTGPIRKTASERQRTTRQRQDAPVARDPQSPRRASEPSNSRGVAQPPAQLTARKTHSRGSTQRSRQRESVSGSTPTAAIEPSGTTLNQLSAADRGKAAHERRKSLMQQPSPVSVSSPVTTDAGPARRSSKRVTIRDAPFDGARDSTSSTYEVKSSHNDRMGNSSGRRQSKGTVKSYQQPDLITRDQAATAKDQPEPYKISPQTAAGREARERVGFDVGAGAGAGTGPEFLQVAGGNASHQRMQQDYGVEKFSVRPDFQGGQTQSSSAYHHTENKHRSYAPSEPALEEWRNGKIATLNLADLDFHSVPTSAQAEVQTTTMSARDKNAAWWERDQAGRRRSSTSAAASGRKPPPALSISSAQLDGPYEEQAKGFKPHLFLKCGPLLRYTGMRREKTESGERVIWRGSVMIVTEDAQSDLSSAPSLRIFAQPMDLLQPPSEEIRTGGQALPPELEDPVAGQVKLSRTGRPLYVRHVRDIFGERDLSREENNRGLYAATRAPMLGPPALGGTASGENAWKATRVTFQDKSRIKRRDGERAKRYRDVKAVRLHTERGFTFWRFGIEIELGSTQHRVAYRINHGPALGFWVPARSESMNIMFHTCNGFSLSVDSNEFSGPDPLWRDVMNKHQIRPFHVMIGGGDQIYNDAAMRDTKFFGHWASSKNPEYKHGADFTVEMQDELEQFYFDRYAMWFSQGLFAMAGSQIPMVNIWDDHDIIDGYGSYPHRFMASRVFTGLGAVAFKYYMLFQHQSVAAETAKEEPSWLLGSSPGPYINELSRSVMMDLGPHVKFLGLDCRTERMRDEILSHDTYDLIFDRCQWEIQKSETKHLIVLLGVPVAYPRLNFLENILTSRVMDPIKAIGRTGMLGGFVNKFDGGVEILDDLDDHWTAKHHKAERNWLIQELQELAADRSVRVTILSGDVHLGAVGQFYTPRKFGIAKDKDHRYMPNVVSSAIVNTPPPSMMADVLNRRNKVHHLDSETDEDLIPMFEVDVDGTRRNNKCLLPRRNYCTIRGFNPGSTPPPTPEYIDSSQNLPATPASYGSFQGDSLWGSRGWPDRNRQFPPGSMRRTQSLTRGPVNLIRRLSGSGRSKNPPISMDRPFPQPLDTRRANSVSGASVGESLFPPSAVDMADRNRPSFHRRPTNLSEKEVRRAAAKGGAPPDEEIEDGRPPAGHINLEGGLDISLNMEVDRTDPAGHTQGYRLLVPALFYDGEPDTNHLHLKPRGPSIIERLKSVKRRQEIEGKDNFDDGGDLTPLDRADQDERSLAPPPAAPLQTQTQFRESESLDDFSPVSPMSGEPGPRSPAKHGYGNDAARESVDLPPVVAPAPAVKKPALKRPAGAYDNGYNLSSPPIGAHYPQQIDGTDDIDDHDSEQAAPTGTRREIRSTGTARSGVGGTVAKVQDPKRTQFNTTNAASANGNGHSTSVKDASQSGGNKTFPYDRRGRMYHDDDDDDSLTPSDDEGAYSDGEESPGIMPGVPPRGLSKAERFFGIGDEGGAVQKPAPSSGGDGGIYVDEDFGAERKRKMMNWMPWKKRQS